MGRTVLEVVVLVPDVAGHVPPPPTLLLEREPDDRLLPPVQRAVRAELGLDRTALELYLPDGGAVGGRIPVLLVLEPRGGRGTATRQFDPAALDPRLRERAASWAAELAGDRPVPALRPTWARPGWTDGAASWLDGRLAPVGRTRSGPLVQQRTWSLSTLLRAETTGGAVWLKACMPRFQAEPSLGGWLSERLPGAVPRVLATDARDRLLLLEEMTGPTVKDSGGEASAPEAPMALARIARATEPHLGALRALGLADRPLGAVPGELRRVLLGPDPVAAAGLRHARSREIVAWVEREASDLARLPIAPALVHGDFHAGNVARHAGRLTIFDWSDAVVGHPLMDAAAWLGEAPDRRSLEARWEPWVDAWSARVAPADLRPRLDAVLGVGAAHQLISLDGIFRAMEPALRHTLQFSAVLYTSILDRLVPTDRTG